MKHLRAATADPTRQPLLDAAQISALLARGRHLAVTTRHVAAERGRAGGSASRHLGSGLDFAEHRRYQPGDDVRRMDWRVTARIGQPHIRRYHEDLVPDAMLLVDRRATMRFATQGRLKVTQAVRLALLLAGIHAARQAPLSVLALDTAMHRYGPLGAAQLPGLGQQLALPCPPIDTAAPSLGEALARLDRDCASGSQLTLLSDFSDAASVADNLWLRLGRRHRVNAILIADPAETTLPATPRASLCWGDAKGRHRLPVDAHLAQRLQQQRQAQLQALQAQLQRAAIALWQVSTIDSAFDGLVRRLGA
jgi:uncharacterized protein (DUF58 family)